MQYIHTMIRVSNLENSLDFFCNKLGLIETHRQQNDKGRFTLVFLAAPADITTAQLEKAPLLELTYNWPNKQGEIEQYNEGRNFGHLAYRVDNIYAICRGLFDAGVVINRPPRDGYMAFIRSPDGISIELLQKGEPLEPVEPWVSMDNTGHW